METKSLLAAGQEIHQRGDVVAIHRAGTVDIRRERGFRRFLPAEYDFDEGLHIRLIDISVQTYIARQQSGLNQFRLTGKVGRPRLETGIADCRPMTWTT